ncbi:MAG TPA: FAD-dependent oxidoreductase [Acidimicrobiales bacterium]
MTDQTSTEPTTTPDTEPDTEPDIVVVGAGLAGLIAATDAARAGSRVTLFDTRRPGGRATTTRMRGFAFNQGAHALYDTGPARAILTSLGVPLTGGPPAVDRGRLVKGGVLHRAPGGPTSLVRTTVLSIRGKAAVGRVLGRLGSFDGDRHRHLTVNEWLDDQRLPDDAADLVRMLVRISTYTDAPDLLSAGAGIAQAAMGLAGVTYLDGGWQRLIDALHHQATAAGVTVRDHTAVTAIGPQGRRWTVETGAAPVTADAVILAGLAPGEAARLVGSTPDELGWDTLGPAVHASCLDLGVRRPAPIPALFSVDEPLYLSTHSPPADLAPEGHGVVQLLHYLAPGQAPEAAVVRARLDAHAARAGLVPDDIVEQRYLHRMTVAHALPLASAGGLAGRPPATVASHPGVFVAGDWVGGVGLLADASAASGRAAAAAAVRWATCVTP